MCSYDDTVIGCPYHACTITPMGVDADGFYCPGNPCYHDDTIEGCPNWSCNFDFSGYDPHHIMGYCPGNICYNDDTIYGCPGHILLPFCEQDPYGLDEQGDFCPQHVCLDPMVMTTIEWCPAYIPPTGNFSSHIHFINIF